MASSQLSSTPADDPTVLISSLDSKLGLPRPPPSRRHVARPSTASTASTAESVLPTYPTHHNRPPSYYTASAPSVSKLGRHSIGPSEADDSAPEPDSDLLLSPTDKSVQDDDDDDGANHSKIFDTLELLSSQRGDAIDPLDRLMAQSQQILETTQEILKSCIDSRRQLDRYTNLESTMTESLSTGERQLRLSLSQNEDREEELDQLAKDVEAYATGSSTSTTRQGFGQLVATQTDPRAFMTRSVTSGHRSRSSISQLQLGSNPDQLPPSASATAVDSLTAALSPALSSPTYPSPARHTSQAQTISSSRASDALAGFLSPDAGTRAPPSAPTPPPASPSAAVTALMRRTSSYATLDGPAPHSPLASTPPRSGSSQRRVTSPHIGPGLSDGRPSLAHSRSAISFQSVAEEESSEVPALVPDNEHSTPAQTASASAFSSPVTPRTGSPAARRPLMGHARKAPSISSLSILTGSATVGVTIDGVDAAAAKPYGALTRSGGYRSLSTPTPVVKSASSSSFQPTLTSITASISAAAPIAIAPAQVPSGELASSVSSVHQRPSSLQQRHSSAGEDLVRVHAEGSSAAQGHRRKDSNLKDTLEGLRGGGGGDGKGKEEGGGWWGWR